MFDFMVVVIALSILSPIFTIVVRALYFLLELLFDCYVNDKRVLHLI